MTNARELAQELLARLRDRGIALTPEQRARREGVDLRNRKIQEGVAPPASGTFGRAKEPK